MSSIGNNVYGLNGLTSTNQTGLQNQSSSTAQPISPEKGSWFSRSSIMKTVGVVATVGVALAIGAATPVGWGIAGAAVLGGVAYACSQKGGAKLEDLKNFAEGIGICCFLALLVCLSLEPSFIASGGSEGEEKNKANVKAKGPRVS